MSRATAVIAPLPLVSLFRRGHLDALCFSQQVLLSPFGSSLQCTFR